MSRFVITNPFGASVLKYDWYASFAAALQDNLHTDHEVLDFSGVSAEDFRFLPSDNNRPLKSARLSCNFSNGLLTVRMPRFAHEITTGLFKAIVDNQLFAMGVFDGFMLLAHPDCTGQLSKDTRCVLGG